MNDEHLMDAYLRYCATERRRDRCRARMDEAACRLGIRTFINAK